MKRVILSFVTIACSLSFVMAQNYDEIKNMLMLRNYKKAKEMLDKNWSNAKFTSKPEAYIIKANVLAGLATDSSMSAQAPELRTQAMEALNKYKELDPKMTALLDANNGYSNGPISMYGGYFNTGITAYREKNWPVAFENFKSAVQMSDFLRENKLADMKLDTNGLLLAGASAQSMKNDAEAEKYFSKLADAKVGGADNEFLYQYLTSKSLEKGDMVAFNKYLATGKELYPNSKYFQYDELDYIMAIEDETKKTQLIEKKLADNPNDYKTQSAYAELLFDKLNPKDSAPLPANYDDVESKMVAAFTKATELKPESGLAMSNIANHYINKSTKIGKQLDSVRSAIREKNKAAAAAAPKPKPGTKPAPVKTDPADAALRDDLTKRYDAAADKAIEYYQKAVDIYSKSASLSLVEKQQYRNGVGYLIDLSAEKKNNSKGTPALYDKWEKEEKKWSDLYHKM